MSADGSPASDEPAGGFRPLFIRTIHILDTENVSETLRTGEMRPKSLLNRKMQLAFGSAMLTLLVVGAISYRGIVVSGESARWVGHTHKVLESVQDLVFAVESIESNSRGFALTGKESYLESYRAGLLKVAQDQAAIRYLTLDDPQQQRQVPALESLTAQKIQRAEMVISLDQAGGPGANAARSGSVQETMDEFLAVAGKLQGEELRLLVLRNADTTRHLSQTKMVLIFGTVLGFLIAAAAGWGAQRDNSARGRAEGAFRDSEEKYRMLLDGVHDYAIFLLDPGGRVVSWNAGAERMKGYTAGEIIGQNFSCFFSPEDIKRGRPEEVLGMTAASGRHEEHGIRVRKDGSQFLASATLTALRDADGSLRGFSEISRDLSESEESEARYRGLLEAAPDAMVVVNQDGEIVLLNVQAEKQFGYRRDELVGQKVKNIIPEGFAERLIADALRSAEDALAQQIGMGIELNGRRKDGSEFPIEIMLSPLEGAEGILVTAAIRDITTRKKAEALMIHSSEHDFLTGLPNRMLLNDRVNQAILLALRHRRRVAVLFLDLDGFKHINDSLGHPTGDKLLQSVGKRLVDCVRGSDTVSRQGGDEFVVLLSEEEDSEDASIAARRMLRVVAEAHFIDPHDLHVTCSVGISLYPDDGLNAETLIKNADTAMYQAKENGRQTYQYFKPAMNVRAVERQSIEEGLRRALERQEFVVHYQPKINLKTGRITGAEALLRWTHPIRGAVSPAQFIPVAEDCGLILPIGTWVLRQACQQARAWVDAGLPLGTMAVNISAMQLRSENFLDGVFAILQDTRLDPRLLELELTESVLMKHAESTASILTALRDRGVQVAVDDFGTGYSSLSYLRKFPIDALKIDQSFVGQITTVPDETIIVKAVIGLGRSLKLRVIAEGVETQEQLAFLQAHQCDEAQGYYFSRPVLPQQFAKLLKSGITKAESAK
jgi:diguanylate cyclase (GGDEF)-like protein/PAS domain S-box-containing protein